MTINIEMVVTLIALQVGVLINRINNAATIINIGTNLNTNVNCFKVLSERSISD